MAPPPSFAGAGFFPGLADRDLARRPLESGLVAGLAVDVPVDVPESGRA